MGFKWDSPQFLDAFPNVYVIFQMVYWLGYIISDDDGGYLTKKNSGFINDYPMK
jgi:hypothetical protein